MWLHLRAAQETCWCGGHPTESSPRTYLVTVCVPLDVHGLTEGPQGNKWRPQTGTENLYCGHKLESSCVQYKLGDLSNWRDGVYLCM